MDRALLIFSKYPSSPADPAERSVIRLQKPLIRKSAEQTKLHEMAQRWLPTWWYQRAERKSRSCCTFPPPRSSLPNSNLSAELPTYKPVFFHAPCFRYIRVISFGLPHASTGSFRSMRKILANKAKEHRRKEDEIRGIWERKGVEHIKRYTHDYDTSVSLRRKKHLQKLHITWRPPLLLIVVCTGEAAAD